MPAPETYIRCARYGCAWTLVGGKLHYAPENADGTIAWEELGEVELDRIDPEVEMAARSALRSLHDVERAIALGEYMAATVPAVSWQEIVDVLAGPA